MTGRASSPQTPPARLLAADSAGALISRATGVTPYFVGKPNPLMIHSALDTIDAQAETTALVGDRMDTDVVVGMEAGLGTVLMLSGVTTAVEAERFAIRLTRAVASVGDLASGRFSVVVPSPTDGVSERADHEQDHPDHDGDQADAPQHRELGHQRGDDEQENAEGDHELS